ncbi:MULTISPECIES: tetratricopeptide repeat protein [unclassified Thermoactinomyces]|jgi:hypothetical protein|uniref:tetratricopeptide repeat protein n=1 Tax=unclassified Thermoactinomyces TaxID=2634588 RepID=UPI0018DB9F95|nr:MULTISPECIES: hypothetical protein [unclassified Thermoactinomyces]MBH8604924.1 hypothetical protein [Thermoactinomyces sp. CICC 10522]MBH8608360.1 hypothetical protein [Thermoactinomyces sp. CICC 10521]
MMGKRTIYTFEEHGEVLAHWHETGYDNETLIYFDRHLDLKKIEKAQMRRIREQGLNRKDLRLLNRDIPFRDDDLFAYGLDNFLYATTALNLVKRVIWVYPEPKPVSVAALGHVLWDLLSLVPGHGEEVKNTFKVNPHSASAQVAGMQVEITTLRRIHKLGLDPDAKIDIDLDYFYEEKGQIVHGVDEVVETLRREGMGNGEPTMTYSISSGFLPRSCRWLGEAVANKWGCTLRSLSRRRSSQGHAEQSMSVIAGKRSLDRALFQRLCQDELQPLEGPGWSLRALLALALSDIAEAERCYQRAVESGDRATWAAYSIGLFHMGRKQYEQAIQWFSRAEGQLVDTIQAHSLSLRALCECKSGQFERSLRTVERCLKELPLRLEAYKVGAVAAGELGMLSEAEKFRELEKELCGVRNPEH